MNLQLSQRRIAERPSPPTSKRNCFRRNLQLGLAALWLLDAALQFQPYMFSRAFATQTIASTAAGNPGFVAWPVTFSAGLIGHHPVLYNAIFASIQLLIAAGIAIGVGRPSILRLALGVSIGWSLGVWWMGEGLGGILTGGTTVYMGAPGAAVLYTLVAIFVWPRPQVATPGWQRVASRPQPVTPGSSPATTSPLGRAAPMLAWVALWASFAYYALVPAMRAPQALSAMMTGMAGGEPGWIKAMDAFVARALAGHGTEVSVVLAALFALAGVAVLVPRAARFGLILAAVLAAALWVSEDFGGIFTGSATDPNTGLPLMMLAACYWPASAGGHAVAARVASHVSRLVAGRSPAARAA
ncbi:MAG: hypothetical protein ACP5P1_15650 [Acidimicrobiales bacterium]